MLSKIILSLLIGLNFLLFAQSQNISQKLADDPFDRPIQVRHIGAEQRDILCYAPVFTNGEGYIYLDYCTSSSVKNARYDVFGRISYNIGGNWLCLSAPSSVTGINGAQTQEWGYLLLRPCVINDKNQKWRIENHSIYTVDKKFKVKDYHSYAFISKNSQDYYDHELTGVMHDWENRVARPGNISLKTPLGWLFKTQGDWALYYLQNNKSTADEIIDLYYNPENGHLAQYNQESGEMHCLTSNLKEGEDWNWASWESCIDQIDKNANKSRYWELFGLNDNEGMLRDYWGNLLRVTSYGPNWGVPYSVKEEYLIQDTTHSPISDFIFSYDINLWNRYTYANLEDSLEYCPAPGATPPAKRVKRSLPLDFTLTSEWISRLYAISASTDDEYASESIGFCGICLLHSYQMVLELINYSSPLASGGYLFNTAPHSNPFNSFRQRFPILAQRLEQSRQFINLNFSGSDTFSTRAGRMVYGMSIGIMPQHIISPSPMRGEDAQINELLQNMLLSPAGSVFIVLFYRTNSTGSALVGHAQPVLRIGNQGVVIVPTNDENSLDSFTSQLQPIQSVEGIRSVFTLRGERRLRFLQTLRIERPFNNSLSITISQNNCTGEGEYRRGSAALPSSATINQCSSGRCLQ